MRLVARKDSRGNVIGFDTVDDNGNIVNTTLEPSAREAGSVEPLPGEPLPGEPLPSIRGDYRSPAERRADEAAAKKEEESDEAAERQYDLDSTPLVEPEAMEPQVEVSEIQETVISPPSKQPQTLPTLLMSMAVVTLGLMSLVLIGVLRKQYSSGNAHEITPTENKKNSWLWGLCGVMLYFIVTKVVIPTFVLNSVDGTDQTEIKFIP